MDEYLHVSIENMHAGQSGNPDRREKERRQQHYSDQVRIAELEAALRQLDKFFDKFTDSFGSEQTGESLSYEGQQAIDAARAVLAKG